MSLVNYLQFLEPVQENFTRAYSVAMQVVAVILVLWLLNFIITMIQRVYSAGKVLGSFYRNYLHKFIRSIVIRVFSIFNGSFKNRFVNDSDSVQPRQIT